ncbi:hypothetical protein MMC17_000710 [Xylographa soralifera]|nr:hypothetical protein [Xylographa soralifera]
MKLSRFLLAAITIFVNASSATVTTPLPSANVSSACIPDQIANAIAAGIDPYGPIPEDYTHRVGEGYHTTAGSNASLWVLAQLDMVGLSVQQKRTTEGFMLPSGIGLGWFVGPGCSGDGTWFDNVLYDVQYDGAPQIYNVVGMSYRSLLANEQLDFSRSTVDACDTYLYSAGYETPAGQCWDSQPFSCFRLWYH